MVLIVRLPTQRDPREVNKQSRDFNVSLVTCHGTNFYTYFTISSAATRSSSSFGRTSFTYNSQLRSNKSQLGQSN